VVFEQLNEQELRLWYLQGGQATDSNQVLLEIRKSLRRLSFLKLVQLENFSNFQVKISKHGFE
jgi:hypothetical protein